MAESATHLTAGDASVCTIPTGPGQPRVSFWDVAVLGGIFAALVYGIGSYGLFEPHEGHFAGVGREMVLNNDWITPRLDGAPYLNKPPLFYWMIAASYSLFGFSEWAARFPQALIGWAGVCLAWKWARDLWGARAGRAAAGILGISAGWYLFSHQLLIDELLCVLHLASLYCLWRAVKKPECGREWDYFYATLGLSVMAKGLVGFAFPVAVLFAFAIVKKNGDVLRNCRPVSGLAIIVAIVAPWVAFCEMRNPGFLRYVLINEHWNRIFDRRWPPDYNASKTSWHMFLVIAAVWIAPWCFFLPQIATFSIKNASRWSGNERSTSDAVAILLLGALLPTLCFVPLPSRLIYYSLPTLPPFAVLAGGWWVHASLPNNRRGRQLAAIVAIVFGIAIAITGQVVGSLLKDIADLKAAPETLNYMPGFALYIGGGLVACGVLLFARKTGAALLALCLPIAIGEASNTAGFSAFDRVRSSKRMVAALDQKLGRDAIWITEGTLEIGSPGATAYYLGENAKGPRVVYIMNSDSPYRRPPSFPGKKPVYLIDDAALKTMWQLNVPVIYVTDFLRTPNRRDDPIRLPPEPWYRVDIPDVGHRQIFANPAARKALEAQR